MNKHSNMLNIARILMFTAILAVVSSKSMASQANTSVVVQAAGANYLPFFPGPSHSDIALYIGNEVNGANNGQIAYVRPDGSQAAPSSVFTLSGYESAQIGTYHEEFNDAPLYSSVISTDGPINTLITWGQDPGSLPGMYRGSSEGTAVIFLGPILQGQAEVTLWIQNASSTQVDIRVDFISLGGAIVKQAQLNDLNPNASYQIDALDDLNNFTGWVRGQVLTAGGEIIGLLSNKTLSENHFLDPGSTYTGQRILVPPVLRNVNVGGTLRNSKLLVANPNSITASYSVVFRPLAGPDIALPPIELEKLSAELLDLSSISALQDGVYAVSVTGSQPVYAAQVTPSGSQSGTQRGSYGSDAAQQIILPRIQNNSQSYSIVSILNTGCNSIELTLEYLLGGDQVHHTETITLPCNKWTRIDMRDVDALGNEFAGALRIAASSAGSVRAWVDEYANGQLPGVDTKDTDQDGLYDTWETQGMDVDGNGSIDLDLPGMGADPNKKDIFVEVDWMVESGQRGHTHKPDQDAIRKIVTAFANAPVDEGKGINLHVDTGPDSIDYVTGNAWGSKSRGNALPHQQYIGSATSSDAMYTQWTALAESNFGHDKRIFHYAIFAHQIAHRDMKSLCHSGYGQPQYFIISLGCMANSVGSENEQAGTFMHELGHSLGLQHGGNDISNYKPNYLSVMNYSFQFGGLIIETDGTRTDGHFDYSRFELPDLVENVLSEPLGINGGVQVDSYGTKYNVKGLNLCIAESFGDVWLNVAPNANGPIDWNCNKLIGTFADKDSVQADINGSNGASEVLHGYDDWANLQYKANGIGSLGVPPTTVTLEEFDITTVEITFEEDLHIPRLSNPRVFQTAHASSESVLAGSVVTYTVTIASPENTLPTQLLVSYTIPADFAFVPGSVIGNTSSEPTVSGSTLRWQIDGPVVDQPVTFSFQAVTSAVPGTHISIIGLQSTHATVYQHNRELVTRTTGSSPNGNREIYLPQISH